MQLKELWAYMQVDMEADRFLKKMKQSQTRQSLDKNKKVFEDQQIIASKIGEEVVVLQDRYEAIQDEAKRLEKALSDMVSDVQSNPPTTPEETAKRTDAVKKLMETISRYEQEVDKMCKDIRTKERQYKDAQVSAARAKAEFQRLKPIYEKECEPDRKQLDELRAAVKKESANVDPALLEQYKAIKKHVTPPMAKVIGGQCTGCFMSLPGATMLELKEEKRIVECDCGRIIFLAE